jgi:hypothetical protein
MENSIKFFLFVTVFVFMPFEVFGLVATPDSLIHSMNFGFQRDSSVDSDSLSGADYSNAEMLLPQTLRPSDAPDELEQVDVVESANPKDKTKKDLRPIVVFGAIGFVLVIFAVSSFLAWRQPNE